MGMNVINPTKVALKPTIEFVIPSSGPRPRRDLQGFLDETGLLYDNERFFGQGLLISNNINSLHRRLIKYRSRCRYHHEFKFTEIRSSNLSYYEGLVNHFFSEPNTFFSCRIHDKNSFDLPAIYNGNVYRTYNASAAKLIVDSLNLIEGKSTDYLTLLADDVSTPREDRFESDVRARVKRSMRRNAMTSIIRLESHAVTEIQLVDVMLGAVAYAHKMKAGLITSPNKSKLSLVQHIENHLSVPSIGEPFERKLKEGIRFSITAVKP